ncbi:MAG: ABC-ATPase domain-containing protein [Bacilli bacterium]
MESRSQFVRMLRTLDGKSYGGYRELKGSYDLGTYTLHIDHVQGDPFAPPSRVRARVHADVLRLDEKLLDHIDRRVAVEDFLTRRLVAGMEALGLRRRGSGRSGVILIDTPGQAVLPRSSVCATGEAIEVRLAVGLPGDGRRIRAKDAEAMFVDDLPFILLHALSRGEFPFPELNGHVSLYCDQCHIRSELAGRGLIAFVGDGGVLARRSGISELPMDPQAAALFTSPDTLRVAWRLPSGRMISGMGVPKGVTLIVGGGFHGKSTLLQAMMRGVYNHIAGDGREWCITDETAVKVRAEDGRRVSRVDISGFISNLPRGRSTTAFSTQDASGSTSQAAAIVEAIELGARVLFMDEDTSAANFMIRDARMQALVAKDREPITPFVDRVRELHRSLGVSSVLVVGGAGDYLDVADVVLLMDEYIPMDATKHAERVCAEFPARRVIEATAALAPMRTRRPFPPALGARPERMDVKSRTTFQFGDEFVELGALEQLIDESQTRAAAAMIRHALARYADGAAPLRTVVQQTVNDVYERGFAAISPYEGCSGFYAMPRPFEIGMIWNRIRALAIR